eukprot:3284536-Rhodomonas_salina.1
MIVLASAYASHTLTMQKLDSAVDGVKEKYKHEMEEKINNDLATYGGRWAVRLDETTKKMNEKTDKLGETLNQKVTVLEQRTDTLEKGLGDVKASISSFENKMQSKTSEIAKLATTLQSLTNEDGRIKNIENQISKLDAMEASVASFVQKISDLETKVDLYETNNDAAQEKTLELRTNVKNLIEILDTLTKQIVSYNQNLYTQINNLTNKRWNAASNTLTDEDASKHDADALITTVRNVTDALQRLNISEGSESIQKQDTGTGSTRPRAGMFGWAQWGRSSESNDSENVV